MTETTEKVFVEGIRTFNKNEKAPDFVIGSVIIEPNTLFAYLKKNTDLLTEYNGEKQLKLQALYSKDGKFLIKIDNWKPDPNYQGNPGTTTNKAAEDEDDLPF